MKKISKTYQEALNELQELVVKIEDPETDLQTISHDVKRALELVEYCKLQLRSYEQEIEKLTE